MQHRYHKHKQYPPLRYLSQIQNKDVLDQDAFKSDSDIGKHQAHIIFCSKARFDP
ncbi:hypothetical protein PPACK8108_LOCUS16167 [Phakopsora pachyrhizi]|uniref:Uncharacterized protein n=1 Tax=Phakopsora pachyrhizi TaxID=170000 RepID=A0AAV0BAL3_PHAPC|nr:hypothetical protein PPACK8108_LOCUS16167 [Phakopsora pachyrhizi]